MKKTLGLLLVLISLPIAKAATGIFTGSDQHEWEQTSIIYGKIVDGEKVPNSDNYSLAIIPYATLTGEFDAAKHPKIDALLYMSPFGAMRGSPPPSKNDLVIVAVRHLYDSKPQSPYYILAQKCMFMPNQKPIIVVEGFDDPVVMQIIGNLRELRKPKEDKSPVQQGKEDSQ